MKLDFENYYYAIIGVSVAATGLLTVLVARYVKRRLENRPQALNIKVTRVQKQDKKEKQKKDKEKEKLIEYMFDTKQYLQHLKNANLLQKCDDKKQRAARILFLEFESIVENPVNGIGLLPRENNLFEWRANVVPLSGAGTTGVFHFTFEIPDNYPDSPPVVTAATVVPGIINNPYYLSYWNSEKKLIDVVTTIRDQLAQMVDPQYAHISLNYTSSKINHNKDHPWPPVTKASILNSFVAKVESYEEKVKKQLVCFYTKLNFEQTQLGLGIIFSKNIRTGELQSIHCSTKLISIKAFNRYKIRKINNFEYTHWLPVYINDVHAPISLVERALSLICTETSNSFEPKMALFVLPKLMNTIVVDTFTGHLSEIDGLRLYCLIHRLLLAFAKKYPEITEQATKTLRDFIRNENKRLKSEVPNLGDMLALLCVTDVKWKDLRDAFYKESSIRNVYWILKSNPKLDPEYKENKRKENEARRLEGEDIPEEEDDEEEISEEERICKSYQATKTGKQILVFQVFFLNNVAQPEGFSREQIAKQYDDFYGLPVENLEKVYQQELQFIKKMRSDDFLAAIGMPATSDKHLVEQLLSDIAESKLKGYHGDNFVNITRPEEFAKQNRLDLKKFCVLNSNNELVFHNDEEKWKQAVLSRWGYETLSEFASAWRDVYLSNHMRDTIEGLNESRDFDYTYECADLCKDDITYLELELFDPTNLKSKYFFLAKILGKLQRITTLKLVRGEVALNDKAFAALCMGLNRNRNISTLILENCGITSDSLESLLSKDLVGDSITKLILSGNTLGDNGARVLANYLAHHSSLPHLAELHLNGCRIGDSGGDALADALVFKTQLRILEIKNNNLRNAISTILTKMAYCPSIERVDFANNSGYVTSNPMERLLYMTGSVKTLNFWKAATFQISPESTITAFANNETLTELDLGHVQNISDFAAFGKILALNKTLKKLCMQSCRANVGSLMQLYNAITLNGGEISLETLDLSNNQLFTQIVADETRKYTEQELAEFDVIGNILLAAKSLKSLDLHSCQIHQNCFKKIGEALALDVPLVSLNLKKNKFGKSIQYLIEPLQKNTTLEELDISGNDLGASGALSVAAFLNKNSNLRKLSLYGNFIEPDGCVAVVNAIQDNIRSKMSELDLGVNRIKARGMKRIIEWMKDQDRPIPLTHLHLKEDHINDVLALGLVNAISSNRAHNKIQSISLYGNPLRTTTVTQIATELAQNGINFDLAKMVEVKQADRQQRTIYIPSLNFTITGEQLKRHFYKHNCGKIVGVEIHNHKKKGTAGAAKYAFVEFTDADSVNIAMNIPARNQKVGSCSLKIFRAGIVQDSKKKKK